MAPLDGDHRSVTVGSQDVRGLAAWGLAARVRMAHRALALDNGRDLVVGQRRDLELTQRKAALP